MSIESIIKQGITYNGCWPTSPKHDKIDKNGDLDSKVTIKSLRSERNPEQEIHRVAYETLQECVDVLATLLYDENYTWESQMLPKSTIGKHVRHIYDHFHPLFSKKPEFVENLNFSLEYDGTLVESLQNGASEKWWDVNYDDRMDHLSIEKSRIEAIKQIKKLQQSILESCYNTSLLLPIHLKATVDSNSLINPIQFSSTYGRELWFCCLHAVHHYALIRVICGEQNIVCPDDFGVAPSTLKKRHDHENDTLNNEE